jgi:hypothetical protein
MSTVYPTDEAVNAARNNAPGNLASVDFHRLRWFIKKDTYLQDSITVIKDVTDSESAQEPYSSSHPISQAALTYPPVSTVTISVDTLDEYSPNWDYEHSKHAMPEGSPYSTGARFDDEGELEHCCGQDLPDPGPTLKIVAEPGAFVTIGQFIETVHLWLQELDGQLRWALNLYGDGEPLDSAVDLYIWPGPLTPLRVLKAGGRKPENFAHDWAQIARMAKRIVAQNSDREELH